MSRELKFRVYSFFDKQFHYFGIQDYPQGIYGGVSEVQQWTGLVDKKGVDIYEGDILQEYSLFNNLPIDKYIAELEVSGRSSQFCLRNLKKKWNFGGLIHRYLTIIGNNLENPELL